MLHILRRPRRLASIVAAVLALLLAAQSVVLAATLVRGGKAVTAVRTVTATDFIEHLPKPGFGFEDMPGMSTTINVPSNTRGLLIITLSSETNCGALADLPDSTGYCYVRVLVDGVGAAPGAVVFDSLEGNPSGESPYAWEANTMQFVAGPLEAGTHTIKVQWRVNDSISFWAGKRTLTVLRSKV